MKYHIIIFVGHRRLAVLVSNEFQTATWYQPRIMLFLINMKSTKTNLIIANLERNNNNMSGNFLALVLFALLCNQVHSCVQSGSKAVGKL